MDDAQKIIGTMLSVTKMEVSRLNDGEYKFRRNDINYQINSGV